MLEGKAVQLFLDRVRGLGGLGSQVATEPGDPVHELRLGSGDGAFTVLAGSVPGSRRLRELLGALRLEPPTLPESYVLCVLPRGHAPATAGVPAGPFALVAGADAHGVLYGLGRLLRKLGLGGPAAGVASGQAGARGPGAPAPCIEAQAPATRDRGVYFATHFSNFYECAPPETVRAYLEEMALWGFNLLCFWFDMNWFPWGFWEDPESRGSRMIARLRGIAETARECGLRVGAMGVANEGFQRQPPPELRAEISGRRGGFYPESQICPSQPGGLAMILDNRRRVLDLLGPLDLYVHWPYDQGGCGCPSCSDAEHRWGRKFLELGPPLARLVRECSPRAAFIVSTWLCSEAERQMVYALCEQGVDWLDGVMLESPHATERLLPPRYSRFVFPEISMFDCFYTSYGCNGANPAPQRFVAEARRAVAAGCGALLYSEGMYEDINKVVWANVLWDPERDAQAIVAEYCRYYFGPRLEQSATDLVAKLEGTWGAARLAQTSAGQARELFAQAAAMADHLPVPVWCRDRWQALCDRAEMDWLLVRIGPETDLLRACRQLLEAAACADSPASLRAETTRLVDALRNRQDLVERLFAVHWRYLEHFHTERTTLLFLPDALLGPRDFGRLLAGLEQALATPDDAALPPAVIRALKRGFWFSGLEVGFLFL